MIKFSVTRDNAKFEIEYDLERVVDVDKFDVTVIYKIKDIKAKVMLWKGTWEEIDVPKWAKLATSDHLAAILLKNNDNLVAK